jgi:hypothetical protein
MPTAGPSHAKVIDRYAAARIPGAAGSTSNRYDLQQPVVLDSVQQRRHEHRRVCRTKPSRLLQHEFDRVVNLVRRHGLIEMASCALLVPPAARNQPSDEGATPLAYADHPAIRVCQESDRAHAAYCDRIRNIEGMSAKIAASGTQDERKLLRDGQVLSIIHAHSYQELSPATGGGQWLGQVVVAQQPFNRRASVCWQNGGGGVDRDYLRHNEPEFCGVGGELVERSDAAGPR